MGGQVDIRKTCKTEGCSRKTAPLILFRLFVQPNAASTWRVVAMRVSRKALGATAMNHSLKQSTDLAMSAFHRSGLSRLAANRPLFLSRVLYVRLSLLFLVKFVKRKYWRVAHPSQPSVGTLTRTQFQAHLKSIGCP